MKKIDFKKTLKHLYGPSAKAVVVDVPEMNFLKIDGSGNPNTSQTYAEAVEALFAVAYTLKFIIKKSYQGMDYGVLPLEGLWWAEDYSSFTEAKKDDWFWTGMIMQPEFVTRELVEKAMAKVLAKKRSAALDLLRFESFHEGYAAQILHIGPYSEERSAIEKLHAFIEAEGGKLHGKHHEIYLSDPRRAAPENLKTVIRQPFTKV